MFTVNCHDGFIYRKQADSSGWGWVSGGRGIKQKEKKRIHEYEQQCGDCVGDWTWKRTWRA